MRILMAVGVVALLSGCASYVNYSPVAVVGVQSFYSGGSPLQLNESGPIAVGIGPTTAEQESGQRHTFRVYIQNNAAEPITVGPENFAISTDTGKVLAVITPEQLQKEARRRATMIAIGAALQTAGNSMNAANAGYSSGTGSYSGTASAYSSRYGSASGAYSGTYTHSGYDAAAAAQAQASANLQNQATMAVARARMDETLASAKVGAFQRQTILPGASYLSDMTISALPSDAQSVDIRFTAGPTTAQFKWNLSSKP